LEKNNTTWQQKDLFSITGLRTQFLALWLPTIRKYLHSKEFLFLRMNTD
jgi:hypothetical protein